MARVDDDWGQAEADERATIPWGDGLLVKGQIFSCYYRP